MNATLAAPLHIPTPPPPRWSRLAVALGLSCLVALHGCPPRPLPVDGGPAVTPSSWTDTARVVVRTLRWALPAARVILAAVLPSDAGAIVGRALDAVADWTSRLEVALDTYQTRGGDRCVAHASVGGLTSAVVSLAQVLADHGVALGTTLERVADSLGALGDELAPACSLDAGWASAGMQVNDRLRAIQNGARARGAVLRHDLDDLRPLDGGTP